MVEFYGPTCPYCGADLEEGHTCEKQPTVAGSERCPMCGQQYDSWLDHLKECDPES